jgi:O-antigen ligase
MEETYDFRYAIWQDAIDIFMKNPFFGIGLGNYSNYVSVHNPDQVWVVDNEFVYFDHPESGYLKFLTELGLSGFVAIYGFILTPMIRGFFTYVKTRDLSVILLTAAVVSWMVGFWSTYSFGDVRIKILIVTILCLIITSKNRIETEQQAALAEVTEDGE